MLPIGFAALFGLVLGRFFKVAVLGLGAAATTIFALLFEWLNGAGPASAIAVAVLGALALQLAYLVGGATAHPPRRPRPGYPPAPGDLRASIDL